MDIRKWLDETVQPEAPGEPLEPRQEAEPSKRKRHRKRSKSDSSLLDPASFPPPPPPRRRKSSLEIVRKAPIERGTADDSASEASQVSLSDGSKSSRYARKPRRKTRPEHYEPGSHADRARKGESKKTRRKSKRKKREQPGIGGVVQNFHAKNVSGDRLTLKPREQLGLFNKGRTSTAVRGRGLPDLVFSEMKFLQKQPQELPEPVTQHAPKKKRKKDLIQTKEGEISAFFTSVRPALIETDANTTVRHDRPDHEPLLDSQRPGRARPSVDDAAIPTIETATKGSYLGFGSRGPRHDSNSYASWSESIRAPSTTPAHPRVEAAIGHDQLVSGSHKRHESILDEDSTSFKRPAPPSPRRQRTEHTTERFRTSSVAPSHNRISRSQSYPHTSSLRRPNFIDRSAKFQSTDTVGSPSSMPPFVPTHASANAHHAQSASSSKIARSRTTPGPGMHTSPADQRHGPSSGCIEADDDIQTSSDLGRVLQQCNDTFHERRQAATPHRRHTEQSNESYPAYTPGRQSMTNPHRTSQRVPTVRFAEPPYQESMLPNFTSPSIYEQQAQRQQLPLQSLVEESIDPDSYCFEQQYLEENDGLQYDDQNWEELAEVPMSYELEEDPETHAVGAAFTTAKLGQDPRPANDVVAPGFWRPNKLY